METYVDKTRKIDIKAKKIQIGENVSFGKDIKIDVNGVFKIGDFSRLGNSCEILGNNVVIGKHLFNSSGLRVGGGGRDNPNADLTIGDRCTIHNNFLNVCEQIVIGDDVGLSPETSVLTHGYWLSVLDGYPASFSGVSIGSGTIIGYRSLVMMGVTISENCVIGAQSVVSKSLSEPGIYAGSPARFIKSIIPLSTTEKMIKAKEILAAYQPIAKSRGIELTGKLRLDYPVIRFNGLDINIETFEYSGVEDSETDDLRDFLRKWGIRIYSHRGFCAKKMIV
jgi:acetyltransferase-like isoleucine patch superfamily enzyme